MIKNRNLSNSALNVFAIYQKLLNAPMKGEDLREDFSNDTLGIYLNTLEKAGIKINRITKPYRYQISDNLNLVNFNKSDIEILRKIKKLLGQNQTIDIIMHFNTLLSKILPFVNDEIKDSIVKIINTNPIGINYHDKIMQLRSCIDKGIPISISYNSPRKGENIYKILPTYLEIENMKLYLWGYDNSIKENRCLKVERINDIKIFDKYIPINKNVNFAICQMSNTQKIDKINFKNIVVLKKEQDKITVKITFSGEFEFFQKILFLGQDCQILEPIELKNKFMQNLKTIKELYE